MNNTINIRVGDRVLSCNNVNASPLLKTICNTTLPLDCDEDGNLYIYKDTNSLEEFDERDMENYITFCNTGNIDIDIDWNLLLYMGHDTSNSNRLMEIWHYSTNNGDGFNGLYKRTSKPDKDTSLMQVILEGKEYGYLTSDNMYRSNNTEYFFMGNLDELDVYNKWLNMGIITEWQRDNTKIRFRFPNSHIEYTIYTCKTPADIYYTLPIRPNERSSHRNYLVYDNAEYYIIPSKLDWWDMYIRYGELVQSAVRNIKDDIITIKFNKYCGRRYDTDYINIYYHDEEPIVELKYKKDINYMNKRPTNLDTDHAWFVYRSEYKEDYIDPMFMTEVVKAISVLDPKYSSMRVKIM